MPHGSGETGVTVMACDAPEEQDQEQEQEKTQTKGQPQAQTHQRELAQTNGFGKARAGAYARAQAWGEQSAAGMTAAHLSACHCSKVGIIRDRPSLQLLSGLNEALRC